MFEDIYGKKLGKVVACLNNAGIPAEIRGNDTARFVFSKINDRAVEISWTGDDGIYVEYWKGREDQTSLREEIVDTFEVASIQAIEWLQCKQ